MSEFVKNIADFMLIVSRGNPYVAILLMTAVPVVGLNGAIPLGDLIGVGMWQTFWLVMFGRAILCMPLLLFWRQIFALGKKLPISSWFFVRVERLLMSKAEKANSSNFLRLYNNKNLSETRQIGDLKRGSVGTNAMICPSVTTKVGDAFSVANDEPHEGGAVSTLLEIEDNAKFTFDSKDIQREQLRKFLIILSYASLPVPLTGVWTSGAVATMMGTKFWVAVPALLIANLINGLLIVGLMRLFGDRVDVFFLIVMAVAIVAILFVFFKIFFQKKASN